MSGERGDKPEPDIEIGAVARAKKLRFKSKPKTHIEFRGEPKIESGSGSKRENLPDEVEPGVTYRDVHIRWGAAARIVPPPEFDEEGESETDESEKDDSD
jgi:hypothetical protein